MVAVPRDSAQDLDEEHPGVHGRRDDGDDEGGREPEQAASVASGQGNTAYEQAGTSRQRVRARAKTIRCSMVGLRRSSRLAARRARTGEMVLAAAVSKMKAASTP